MAEPERHCRCAPRPKDAHSTVLSIEDEAIIVASRKHTLLRWMICCEADKINMTLLRGWSKRGSKLVPKAPFGK